MVLEKKLHNILSIQLLFIFSNSIVTMPAVSEWADPYGFYIVVVAVPSNALELFEPDGILNQMLERFGRREARKKPRSTLNKCIDPRLVGIIIFPLTPKSVLIYVKSFLAHELL